jgi:hypothetical protein
VDQEKQMTAEGKESKSETMQKSMSEGVVERIKFDGLRKKRDKA